MSALVNLSISHKLMAAFAAVLAVILASSAVTYDRLRVIEEAKNWRVHTTVVLETLGTMIDALLDQEAGVRDYFITSDEHFLQGYHRGGDAFTAALRKAKALTADNPAQQSRLDELDDMARKWRSDIAERVVALAAKPETREGARALLSSGAANAMDVIRGKADEIAGVERDLLAKRSAVQEQAYATAYTVTILGGAVSLIIAMLMGALLTRSITVPITRMTGAMGALAKGDTSVDVPGVGRSDEIGAMAAAVEVFKDSIIERQRAQAELAHASRVAAMGQLTASVAHEVSQPITGVMTSGYAALRWLGNETPDLSAARRAIERVIKDGKRAGDVIDRVRDIIKNAPPRRVSLDINEAIGEVIALARSEMLRRGVPLQTRFATDLPPVVGDRIQLQQVVLNLILNAVEAMSGMDEGARALLISTGRDTSKGVLVSVRDSGPGLDPDNVNQLFETFYTTKAEGLGVGLAICRTIVEAHGGRIWASANEPRGAIFQFTLPAEGGETIPARAAGQMPVG